MVLQNPGSSGVHKRRCYKCSSVVGARFRSLAVQVGGCTRFTGMTVHLHDNDSRGTPPQSCSEPHEHLGSRVQGYMA